MTPDPENYIRKDDGKIYFKYFDGTEEETSKEWSSWPIDLNDIKVTQINPTDPKIILASFNAG
jgi:hypothetical protein